MQGGEKDHRALSPEVESFLPDQGEAFEKKAGVSKHEPGEGEVTLGGYTPFIGVVGVCYRACTPDLSLDGHYLKDPLLTLQV